MQPIPMTIDPEDVEAAVVASIEGKLSAAGRPDLMVQPGSFGPDASTGYHVTLVERPKPVRPKSLSLKEFLASSRGPGAGEAKARASLPAYSAAGALPPGSVVSLPRYREPTQSHASRRNERLPPPVQAPAPPHPAPRPAYPEPDHVAMDYATAVADALDQHEEEPPPLGARPDMPVGPNEPILYGGAPAVSAADREAFKRLQESGLVAAHLTPELMASSSREDILDGVGQVLKNGHVKGSTVPAGHEADPHKNKPWRRKQTDIRDTVAGALRKAD